MTWNYRVLRREVAGETVFAIHEVYYDEKRKPEQCTAQPVVPEGRTRAALTRDVAHYTKALTQPVLDYEAFGAGKSGQAMKGKRPQTNGNEKGKSRKRRTSPGRGGR